MIRGHLQRRLEGDAKPKIEVESMIFLKRIGQNRQVKIEQFLQSQQGTGRTPGRSAGWAGYHCFSDQLFTKETLRIAINIKMRVAHTV